jgi:predicted regulator of Ras-like GTPase activity (Roadblock/LC7/MglB family)
MNDLATLPNVIHNDDPSGAGTYDMLRNALATVPGIRGLVLLANDGIPRAAYGVALDDAQRITAACSGMASLADHLSNGVDGGPVLHTVVSMKQRSIVVTSCGRNSTLCVALDVSTPIGLAMMEITRKARAYAEQMGTRSRPDLPVR